MEEFEEKLHQDLHQFLLSMKEVDERMPECPDVEGKWEEIAKAYIPDGIREFQDFPSASLGWKACYDDERNLYTVKTSWRGDYDLYEINEEIYSQLGKPGTNADELIHSGRHLYYRGDNSIGPSTAMVIDDRYAELCPWANLPESEKTMSKELTDIAVDLWENEATREQRKKQKEK